MILSKYFKCIAIGFVISTNPAFGQEISRKEYIEKGFDLFFRDGTTKGFGTVIEVL